MMGRAIRSWTEMHSFALTDQDGRTWELVDALKESAVVLVFYRGDW